MYSGKSTSSKESGHIGKTKCVCIDFEFYKLMVYFSA